MPRFAAANKSQISDRFPHSNVRLKRVRKIQMGVMDPQELVRAISRPTAPPCSCVPEDSAAPFSPLVLNQCFSVALVLASRTLDCKPSVSLHLLPSLSEAELSPVIVALERSELLTYASSFILSSSLYLSISFSLSFSIFLPPNLPLTPTPRPSGAMECDTGGPR